MLITIKSHPIDFEQDVGRVFDSLPWVYLSHRYTVDAQGQLLRLLTLAGLAPSAWLPCTVRCVSQPGSLLARALAQAQRGLTADSEEVRILVGEIHAVARHMGASFGEPPRFPSYLVGYGYTQEAYLHDLSCLYGPLVARQYDEPWPVAASLSLAKYTGQPTLFDRSVAVMGATAGAIERLLALGG